MFMLQTKGSNFARLQKRAENQQKTSQREVGIIIQCVCVEFQHCAIKIRNCTEVQYKTTYCPETVIFVSWLAVQFKARKEVVDAVNIFEKQFSIRIFQIPESYSERRIYSFIDLCFLILYVYNYQNVCSFLILKNLNDIYHYYTQIILSFQKRL